MKRKLSIAGRDDRAPNHLGCVPARAEYRPQVSKPRFWWDEYDRRREI